MNRKLIRAQNIIAQAMADDLAPLFTPDMRMTFIARSIDNPDCYMILTDEANADLSKVNDTINRHAKQLASSRTGRDGEVTNG